MDRRRSLGGGGGGERRRRRGVRTPTRRGAVPEPGAEPAGAGHAAAHTHASSAHRSAAGWQHPGKALGAAARLRLAIDFFRDFFLILPALRHGGGINLGLHPRGANGLRNPMGRDGVEGDGRRNA